MRKSKLTWLLAAFAGLLAGSCSNDEVVTTMGGNDVITFTVNSDNGVQTRAGGALTIPDGKKLRYIMEVYNESGDYVADSRQEKLADEVSHSAEFSYLRPQGAVYTAVFWADFTNAVGADAKTDVYYNTTTTDGGTTTGGLTAITVNSSSTEESCGEAFYGSTTIDEKLSTTATVELKHAVSVVTLKTTAKLEGLGSVKVTYGKADNENAPYSTFNALTGAAAATQQTIEKVNEVNADAAANESNPYDFHTFYVFAPAEAERLVNMEIEMYSATATGTPVQTFSVPSLPLRTNYKTNVTGNFAMANDVFTISCSADWGAEPLEPASVWDGTSGTSAVPGYGFSGGTGAVDNPYIIGKAEDLAQLATNINANEDYTNTYFKLTTDIDLKNGNWTPIGLDGSKSFKGNFDGEHHKIKNLRINSSNDYVGLFGYVEGNISNLHIIGGEIESSTTNSGYACGAGGVCGYLSYNGGIANCSFQGAVTGVTAGGIVGVLHGGTTPTDVAIVSGSKNYGTISGSGHTGGIVGYQQRGGVCGCYNVGTIQVSATTNWRSTTVGGISGYFYYGSIIGCYNAGEVKAELGGEDIGAIAGVDVSNVKSCYAVKLYAKNSSETTPPQEFKFGNGVWPTGGAGNIWYADGNNNGEFTCTSMTSGYYELTLSGCKFWKDLGAWNEGGATSEYPKLWWEK